ncbi:type I-E CRISPR-associated protein Cas5/CasD [Aliagarivorans taiwanensis]|uniref:type I-E CRISPR-associated protein Cas5/CasD n=1 Tax=Aliagarivorans taiwanensis TaxID=561966 RepID=UPI00047EC780|nr:type I-E CRISPR-associated protein Cas5/CasD [Aliagarivorans taiwanensis]
MREYLVFRLYGPMASWGQPAVGGDRPTALAPTRSALLGLLGAALGIKREDEAGLARLQQSVCFGIKQCVPGTLMRDYHTTQVPIGTPEKLRHCRTRKAEIDECQHQEKFNAKNSRPNAILSSRDYRCDALWVIAAWLSPKAELTLEQLQTSLQKPVFTLYLGRKSCPLALPLMPQLLPETSLQQALDHPFPALVSEKADPYWLGANHYTTYFWEGDVKAIEHAATQTYHPWDEPQHRGRWQFKQRAMHQLTIREA